MSLTNYLPLLWTTWFTTIFVYGYLVFRIDRLRKLPKGRVIKVLPLVVVVSVVSTLLSVLTFLIMGYFIFGLVIIFLVEIANLFFIRAYFKARKQYKKSLKQIDA